MIYKLIRERFSLFKDQPFLLICISGLLSTFGNGLVYVSTSWFAYEYYNSISGVALMMFFLWGPGIIFSPIFGVCADRFNKKYIIVMSNLVRGIAVILFSLAFMHATQVNIFYLACVLGVFVSFYMPAAVPLITNIIPKENFVKANSTVDMIYELGVVSGMGMSGVFIHFFGMLITLLIGGCFFCLSALAAGLIRYSEKQDDAKDHKTSSMIKHYYQALKYLGKSRVLLEVYFIQSFVMLILMTVPIILVPYVKESLNAGAGVFAMFESLYSLGILIGCCMIDYLNKRFGFIRLFSFQMLVMACSLFVMSASQIIGLSMLAYLACGWCLSSWALTLSQSQSLTDVNFQGRLQALSNSVSGAFILSVYLLVTLKSDWIHIHWLYLIASICAFIVGLSALFFKLNSQGSNQSDLNIESNSI